MRNDIWNDFFEVAPWNAFEKNLSQMGLNQLSNKLPHGFS